VHFSSDNPCQKPQVRHDTSTLVPCQRPSDSEMECWPDLWRGKSFRGWQTINLHKTPNKQAFIIRRPRQPQDIPNWVSFAFKPTFFSGVKSAFCKLPSDWHQQQQEVRWYGASGKRISASWGVDRGGRRIRAGRT